MIGMTVESAIENGIYVHSVRYSKKPSSFHRSNTMDSLKILHHSIILVANEVFLSMKRNVAV